MEEVVESDMASGDFITCSDTDEVTIQTTQKKYWKRVPPSCRLSKGILWTEAKLKRISKTYQAIWDITMTAFKQSRDSALVEDCNSFGMCRMMVGTDQLLPHCKSH